MTWLIFLAASLACFRLTRLITDDKIFDWLRAAIVRESPRKAKRRVKQGITCPFCVSFWFATLITLYLFYVLDLYPIALLFWQPAIWGASVLLNQLFCRLSR